MTKTRILHQVGRFWVKETSDGCEVYETGVTHSTKRAGYYYKDIYRNQADSIGYAKKLAGESM